MNKLELFAKENKVPIILKETKEYFVSFFNDHKIDSVLEIGSAIGYSALFFAQYVSHVTTIEKDSNMINLCKKNISSYDYGFRIRLIEGDAKETFSLVSDRQYDLLFIDASKANYKIFFDLYYPLVKNNGFIICDNMDFHLLKSTDPNLSKRLRKMLVKLEEFREYILTNFNSNLLHIGDGILVIKK